MLSKVYGRFLECCGEGDLMGPLSQQEFLRNAMAALGMTRVQFSARIGVGVKTVNKWLAPDGSAEYRRLPSLAINYVKDIIKWEVPNYCNTPNVGISSKNRHAYGGGKMTLKDRLLDAVLDGRIGHGLVVTRKEVIEFFNDENENYTGVLLSNAEMDTATHSPTWEKYTQRIGRGVYRIHPDSLSRRLDEREAPAAEGNPDEASVECQDAMDRERP